MNAVKGREPKTKIYSSGLCHNKWADKKLYELCVNYMTGDMMGHSKEAQAQKLLGRLDTAHRLS